jgi:hypothetical protein
MAEQPTETQSVWGVRAERLLERALDEVRSGEDAISTVSAAEAALRIELGELPEDAMAGYPFPGEEDDEDDCICPPDLLARGGFKGGCPVHA